jgi:hypothetical protein
VHIPRCERGCSASLSMSRRQDRDACGIQTSGRCLTRSAAMSAALDVHPSLIGSSSMSCHARTQVCLPNSPFLLRQLMLRAAMGTLLGDDLGAALAPPDPPNIGAFAGRAPARNPGLAAPA